MSPQQLLTAALFAVLIAQVGGGGSTPGALTVNGVAITVGGQPLTA